jgi:hypothetical protein
VSDSCCFALFIYDEVWKSPQFKEARAAHVGRPLFRCGHDSLERPFEFGQESCRSPLASAGVPVSCGLGFFDGIRKLSVRFSMALAENPCLSGRPWDWLDATAFQVGQPPAEFHVPGSLYVGVCLRIEAVYEASGQIGAFGFGKLKCILKELECG